VLSAYVLLLTEVGKVAHIAQALSDLDGVQVAEDITGPYDIIARFKRPVWPTAAHAPGPARGGSRRLANRPSWSIGQPTESVPTALVGRWARPTPPCMPCFIATVSLSWLIWTARPGRWVRYQRQRPGELLHVDVKKQGRIPDGGGHRIHGRRRARRRCCGCDGPALAAAISI
jgi:hypothetical protein